MSRAEWGRAARSLPRTRCRSRRGERESTPHPWRRPAKPRSEYNIGVAYYKAYGVTQNYAEAAIWFRRAADQGFADAEACMGWMYEHGEGLPRNVDLAIAWYRKAAAHGKTTAAQNLAVLTHPTTSATASAPGCDSKPLGSCKAELARMPSITYRDAWLENCVNTKTAQCVTR